MVRRNRIRRLLVAFLITLSGLIVVVAVAAARQFSRASRQRAVVEHIKAIGGTAHYDWQIEDKMGPTDLEDFVRETLSNPALFADVAHVDLAGTNATDDDLQRLNQVEGLQFLFVTDTAISDSAIRSFERRHPACRIRR